MNFKPNSCNYSFRFEKEDNPTLSELQSELESLRKSIADVEKMNLSEKTKKLCLYELGLEVRGLKNKMHDLIEEL